MSIFEGSGVAIVTPFNDKGVNYEKLKELLEWHIQRRYWCHYYLWDNRWSYNYEWGRKKTYNKIYRWCCK